ncbi:hypothetical protein [Vibrio atlanticus]|uniref:hypothetical protein n=1 Tax=Vibrio atlanticus TaxID=693153 RepID=UPI003D151737
MENIKSEILIKRRQSYDRRRTEMILWSLVGLIVSGRAWFDMATGNGYPYEKII